MLMTPNAYLRPYFATDYWTIFFICLLVCLKGTSELLILQLPPTPPLTSPPLPQHTHAKHVYFSYFQVLTLDKCQSHTHSCLNQRPGTIPDSFFFSSFLTLPICSQPEGLMGFTYTHPDSVQLSPHNLHSSLSHHHLSSSLQ